MKTNKQTRFVGTLYICVYVNIATAHCWYFFFILLEINTGKMPEIINTIQSRKKKTP